MTHFLRILSFVCAGALLAGCHSTYRAGYHYVPHPGSVQTQDTSGGVGVRTLASVIGIRNADKEAGLPLSVEVRLQIENNADQPVAFDPATLRLISGDLRRFQTPITRPEGPIDIPPAESATVSAWFPFPEGYKGFEGVLAGFNLQWTLTQGGRTFPQSITFTRRADPDRFNDYHPHPHFGVGFGVGTVID